MEQKFAMSWQRFEHHGSRLKVQRADRLTDVVKNVRSNYFFFISVLKERNKDRETMELEEITDSRSTLSKLVHIFHSRISD